MTNLFSPPLPRKPGDRLKWGKLIDDGPSFATAAAARAWGRTTLVITPTMNQADRLERNLKLLFRDVPDAPEVMHFADWETLPYDNFSPHQDIISERMHCLYNLSSGSRGVVVVSAPTLMQRLAPPEYILAKSLVLKVGQALDREAFREKLVFSGYNSVDTVYQHGEFAIRGSLVDVYPMGSRLAYRVELFDNEVESLREFDPETQRTVRQVDSIDLLPAREFPLDKNGIATFRTKWHERFNVDHRNCPVYQDVTAGLSPAGIEYYLPLFFGNTASLFDYLPKESLVLIFDGLENAVEEFWREANSRYESRNFDIERPLLKPAEVFQTSHDVFSQLKPFPRVLLNEQELEEKQGNSNFSLFPAPTLLIDNKAKQPLYLLEEFAYRTDKRILLCAESNGRKETLKELLAKINIQPAEVSSLRAFAESRESIAITVADFEHGVYCNDPNIFIIAESRLFGARVQQYRRRKTSYEDHENVIKNLTELKIGAPVVHIDHGVGRYRGLQTIEHDGQADEFLVLEYAEGAKLYVPVGNLHLIGRYSGAEEDLAPLHRLGSEQWQRAKRKAAEQIRDVAAELLDIYARRKARAGFAYAFPKDSYELFVESFPFEETPDQQAAIEAVRDDMLAPRPMDRLVCGDVGFGKTEVAMRAAFIAVQNGKQVAILVPTTLLAQQHFDNFKDRFADWPVNIEMVSRFRSTKEIDAIQKRLESGSIDIVIGTHKLIQGSLKYPKLGLVIIDEEHRFGVRQKEALKSLRAEVDILTMTATPIPRTLNMSMAGIRDLSIIATPPAKRLSVKTFVRESDLGVIKEAIMREIMRGGQVYYLHNEVKTIDKTARDLQELAPEARIRVGHGQMRERDLEAVMSDFYHRRFNILVCTTIIETGIDVPTANTIIIDRADKFGLAQLHQLRGRVGRSHHQAYAYMLTPNKKAMTQDALKRLEAIMEAQDLGAGFMLASHDLEIRGAGELLGEEQSGQIQSIGFSLYMDMLDRAVKAIQAGKTIDLDEPMEPAIDINLRIPALIPDDYLPDVHTRLTLYKRISSVKSEDELNELQVEMIDRFGLLPDPTKNLVRQTRLRFAAERLGITKVEANRTGGRVEFARHTRVDPLTIVKMVQNQPQNYRLEGANHLRFVFDMDTPDQRLNTVNKVFEHLRQAS